MLKIQALTKVITECEKELSVTSFRGGKNYRCFGQTFRFLQARTDVSDEHVTWTLKVLQRGAHCHKRWEHLHVDRSCQCSSLKSFSI